MFILVDQSRYTLHHYMVFMESNSSFSKLSNVLRIMDLAFKTLFTESML